MKSQTTKNPKKLRNIFVKKNSKKLYKYDEKVTSLKEKGESTLKELIKLKGELDENRESLDSLKEFWLREMAQIKKQSNEMKGIKPKLEKLACNIQASTDLLTKEKLKALEVSSKISIQNIKQNLEDTKILSLDIIENKFYKIDQLISQQKQILKEATQKMEDSTNIKLRNFDKSALEAIQELESFSHKKLGDIKQSSNDIAIRYKEELEKIKIFFSQETTKQISSAKKLGGLSLAISLMAIILLFLLIYIGWKNQFFNHL